MVRYVLAFLVLCFGVTGCATTQSSEVRDRLDADPELSPVVFAVALHRIDDVFLETTDFRSLSLSALGGLQSIDPAFRAEIVGSELVVRSGGREVARLASAASNDVTAWAALSFTAVETARHASPQLAAASAEDLYEAYFDAAMRQLDSYSRYLSAAESENEVASRDGYGGVGLVIEAREDEGTIVVRDVFARGPAAQAGLRAGDLLEAVDGVPTRGLTLSEVARRLRGPVDTDVTIRFLRDGRSDTRTMVRERVIQNVVSRSLEGDVLVLRISRFNSATVRFVNDAIRDTETALGRPASGIVLDLRGNPGGLLDQSVGVADLFIASGDIVSTRGRHPQSLQRYRAGRSEVWPEVPIVVLVDDRTASGAEVLAAALQDSGRAVVAGSSSFGKGSVQTVTTLPNSGELFLTWSRIYAPSGYSFHEQGVLPTICTSRPGRDARGIVDLFVSGGAAAPANVAAMRMRAPDDPRALEEMRAICPWVDHDPALDMDVALSLLADPTLFARALSASHYATAAAH